MFLEFLSVLMLVSHTCTSLYCQNCTAEHIRIMKDAPGECDICWPCSLLECQEGKGSSVACGTSVPLGQQIECVNCVHGANFSHIIGSEQCQPCGLCTGVNEQVLVECTTESDVQCECEDGFFRNMTTKECLPCASCCTFDGKINKHCREDDGEIEAKCKFKELQPSSICLSFSTTAPGADLGFPVQTLYLSSSSFLVIPSFTRATQMLLLDVTSLAPAPSQSVQIKVTEAIVPSTRSSNVLQVLNINTENSADEEQTSPLKMVLPWLVSVGMFLLIVGCVKCIIKSRSHSYHIGPSFVSASGELEAAKEEEEEGREEVERKPSNHSGISELLLNYKSQAATNAECKRKDSLIVRAGTQSIIYLPEQNREDIKLEKGTASSLHSAHNSQGDQKGKCLSYERDDQSGPCFAVGQQPQCYTNDFEEEPVNVTVDEMSASYLFAFKSASPSKDENASLSLTTVSSRGNDQRSRFLPNDSEIEIHHEDQREVSIPSAEPPLLPAKENLGYLTHIKDVPHPVICDLCMLLDEERDIDGKDYRMFASELGLKPVRIRYLKDQKQSGRSPSRILLMQVFLCMENSGTLKDLCAMFKRMGRYDLITVIDEWVHKNS